MDNVLRMLRDVRNNLSNLGSGDAAKVLEDYQRWASQSAQTLGLIFDHSALDYLILTRRHWWLMETSAAGNGPSVLDAFRAEQTDRQRVFDQLIGQSLDDAASCAAPQSRGVQRGFTRFTRPVCSWL